MGWFKANAWWLLLVLVGVFGFVLAIVIRDKDRPDLERFIKELQLEREVLLAKAEAAKIAAEKGHAEAIARIKKQYEERIAALEAAQAQKVEELENDPEALVDYLLRLS